MKKIITVCVLLGVFIIEDNVWADAISNLRNRLNKINSFHAEFTQRVTDVDGNIVQEGQGDLWIKYPNLFNWHLVHPDESFIISDGSTLWFYNPFIEQATAVWLKDVIDNTPFMLIICNQLNDWNKYCIKQVNDNFVLTPKNININLKEFIINISQDGTIHSFSTLEQDGQYSDFKLKYKENRIIGKSKFTFSPLQNVTIDDQRE